jgi:hypothetical protein
MRGMKFIALCLTILCSAFSSSFPEREDTSFLANEANTYMWDQLHLGNYDSLPKIIGKLESAWQLSENDPELNKHLGFVYFWKFGERARAVHDTSVFRNVFLSNYYFKKAIEVDPADDRIYSLQAAAEMCEGAIREDRKQIRKGYFSGKEAVKKWPQFNRFALAAVVSVLNKHSPMFQTGLRYQWITIDECSCRNITKKDMLETPEKVIPELIEEIRQSSDPRMKRACWNTWIAPHNFEGYFLNFGDMLVKKGYLKEAARLYAAIKLSPSYKEWPFQAVLEERIRDLKTNETEFNKPLQLIVDPNSTQIYINSKIACVGCHQMGRQEYKTMKREQWQ